MLPPGHLGAGVLLGARLARRRRLTGRRAQLALAAGALAGIVPDLDTFVPTVLDALGVRHRLRSGEHHGWPTHTPGVWAPLGLLAWRAAGHPRAPRGAQAAVSVLGEAVAAHIALDATANTVALLWPWRRRRYGLALDGMSEVSDHGEYFRRYYGSMAGALELAIVLAACAVIARHTRSGVIGS